MGNECIIPVICVFALGHTVIAYRTSCRSRRKLMCNRVDPDSAFLSKVLFPFGKAKLPRSSTSADMSWKSDNKTRQKQSCVDHNDQELPIKLLADVDSLFMVWNNLTIHYKLHIPNPPSRTLSSTTLLDNPSLNSVPKPQNHLRSYSIQFQDSSIYAPLLDDTSSNEEVSVLNVDEVNNGYFSSKSVQEVPDVSGKFGVVLVHGFGGGMFSWRHVMAVMSRQVNCVVASFDRPGWGLTSRPRRDDWEANKLPNPYMLDTQLQGLYGGFVCNGCLYYKLQGLYGGFVSRWVLSLSHNQANQPSLSPSLQRG